MGDNGWAPTGCAGRQAGFIPPVVKGAPAVKTFTALWILRPGSVVTGSIKASAGVVCAGAGAGPLGALDAVGIAGAVTRRGERPRRPNCESGAISGVNGVGIGVAPPITAGPVTRRGTGAEAGVNTEAHDAVRLGGLQHGRSPGALRLRRMASP